MATTTQTKRSLGTAYERINAIVELAFYNGRFGDIHQFGFNVKSALAHYAAAIFEGVRFFRRAGIFLPDPHRDRFRLSFQTYRFEVPEGFSGLDGFLQYFWDAARLVVAINSAKDPKDPDLYLRPFAGRGVRVSSGSGLHVRSWDPDPRQRVLTDYLVVTERWPSYIATDAVIYREFERPTRRFAPVWAKGSMNYPNGTNASNRAVQLGGNEALMIRTSADGTVYALDGPGQAIAIVENGVAISPDPEASDILESTQMLWFKNRVAPRLGIKFIFDDVPLPRLLAADELLYMGSATGMVAFGEVWDELPDGSLVKHRIGTGVSGPVYRAFRNEYDLAKDGRGYDDDFEQVPSTSWAIREVAERMLEQP
jgi:branched-subunit amino acid aminotransferase/4-amino-4-deoxychorismate lyase